MKKILFVLIALVALTMTGCDAILWNLFPAYEPQPVDQWVPTWGIDFTAYGNNYPPEQIGVEASYDGAVQFRQIFQFDYWGDPAWGAWATMFDIPDNKAVNILFFKDSNPDGKFVPGDDAVLQTLTLDFTTQTWGNPNQWAYVNFDTNTNSISDWNFTP